ncbi:antitoxin ChpS [Pseudomonas reinekei]|uniref:AbrB family transcriptional regulator n=1 Tax=Pseudomonas reinekei TaxID=395598 RepID=A0A1H0PAJ1_PSERE|nr:AbrB family transcriptional regulator [Pseudomonas reinekei]KAB0485752.1 AbrB/MazE/SpoVT family DNA-binding domain-containing protein [Pseudomonas reinekei]OLU02604.1 AbrB family transcriptional regulator [Pseudomonas reinekei]SDP02147.1 antitoxin ChpS [Pseudomonas reinekei]
MSETMRTTVVCQDPGDGSGEIIIEIPPDVLKAMSIGLGDSLRIKFVDGAIVLEPDRDVDAKS